MNFSSARLRLLLILMVVAALGVACTSASAAWTIRSTTLPTGTTESRLYSVSCTTEKSCWAVGEYRNSSGVLEPLAYQTVSSTYGLPPTPGKNPQLFDISCPQEIASDFCMAVGRYTNSSGSLRAFAEKYTLLGGWELQTLTYPSGNTAAELGSVSCPTEKECVAVGDFHNATGEQYLAERWTSAGGGTWTPQTPTEPSGGGFLWMSAISCPGTEKCVAEGNYQVSPFGVAHQKMETETFTNTGWANQGGGTPAPFGPGSGSGPAIGADSCLSMTECIGVGFYTNTTPALEMMAWKGLTAAPGSGWTQQTTTALADETQLSGVSCWSVTACVATGQRKRLAVGTPLAEELSGTTWTQVTVPAPSGASESTFDRDACISSGSFCFGVGWSVISGVTSILVERNF
jgi:hypothetical protein